MTLTISTDELTPLGYTADGEPIWPVFGSERNVDPSGNDTDPDAEENDDSDEEDDDSEETDDEGGAGKGEEGEWKPPSKEEWERTQRALKRANGQAKKHRLAQKSEGGDDAAKKAAEEAEKKFKPVAVRSSAKAALLEAGLNDASDGRIKKLMRMIDMDDVEVDEDGDVVGLDDQIDSIRDDYPELFGKKEEPKKRATKLDAAGRNGSGSNGSKLSTGEKVARQVLGKG